MTAQKELDALREQVEANGTALAELEQRVTTLTTENDELRSILRGIAAMSTTAAEYVLT